MEWTNENIINLIKEIEIRPVFWDSSHVDYKNRNKKQDELQELAEKFYCDTAEVVRKWKIILAQYRREKQKIRSAKSSGVAASDMYKPKWFGFEYLQFLRERDELNESGNPLDDINEPVPPMQGPFPKNEPVSEESQDNVTEAFKHNTTKRQRLGGINDTKVSEAFAVVQHIGKEIKDDVDFFSSGVAAKLRQIKNEHLKLSVQRDIDNLLYDALLGTGKYANDSSVILSQGNSSPSTCSRDSNSTININTSSLMVEGSQNDEENPILTTESICSSMPCCAAVNCSNRSEKNIRLFRFPKDASRRAKWVRNTCRDSWVPSNSSYLCEKHFEDSQFEKNRADGWRKLIPNAVPTVYAVPIPPPRINQPPRKSLNKRVQTETASPSANKSRLDVLESIPSISWDHVLMYNEEEEEEQSVDGPNCNLQSNNTQIAVENQIRNNFVDVSSVKIEVVVKSEDPDEESSSISHSTVEQIKQEPLDFGVTSESFDSKFNGKTENCVKHEFQEEEFIIKTEILDTSDDETDINVKPL